jgi:protein-tyrosine phosphatase
MYVDLHCHLLPGIDDGSADLDAAVAHVRRLEAAGVRDVACTPHIKRAEFPDVDIEELAERLAIVREAVKDRDVRIHGGGEVAHEEALALTPREIELVAQGPAGGRWLLLECPFEGLDHDFLDAIDRLHSLGYGVLAAHPERSFDIASPRRMAVLRAAVERGALLQVNVCSLLGNNGPVARDVARRLLPVAHCLASDGHPGKRDDLLAVAADLLDEPDTRRLTQENPGTLLRAGADRPPSPSAARSWNARRPRWAAEAAC